MSAAGRRIRIAVIGAGTITQSVHLACLRRAGFTTTWICDLSPSRAEELGRANGTRWSARPEEILVADDVDAVLIATSGAHDRLAEAALRAGKHVLAEKPLALTVAGAERLQALAAGTGRVLQVGYMKMHDPLIARARAELEELREIRLVRVTVAHPADDPQVSHLRMQPPPGDADPAVLEQARRQEAEDVARALPGASPELGAYYAGVLNGSVIHELSLLRALGLPMPHRWWAEVFPELGGPEPACLLAHGHSDAARYLISWNWLPDHPEYEEEVRVLAGNGRLTLHLAKPYLLEDRSTLRVERAEGSERRDVRYTDGHETGFLRQLDAFADSIRTGSPVLADAAGAAGDTAQLQLLARAIGAGRGEHVADESAAGPHQLAAP